MEGVLVRRGNVSRSCTPAPSQCVQQTLSITDNAIRKPFESPPFTVAIERIQTALQYYENMEEKQTDDGQLVYLCNTIYKSLLEDWIHVLAEHPKHPIEPHYTCDILYCPIANRHYFNKMVHDINVETEAVFYRELLDSIHCYVYHLEDVGLRVLTKCRLEQSDDITDLQLAHIRTTQKSKAKILHENGLEMSINIDKTNKYDLIPTMQSTANYQGTLMDMLCRLMDRLYATNNGRFARETQHCFAVLLEEDYDSESVEYDLEDVSQSNFALHSIACYNAIERYLHLTKLYRYTFSIGYRFYYHHWSKFKSALNMTHTPMNDDPNDLQSHSIKAKYKSLQDEILNNTISHLPKIEFNVSLVKANKYLETRKAKQMVCILDEFGYGFKKGDTIRRSHLLSIILYCQYTKLQRELTTTFRKNEEYECIESVIQRHREFAIWSRLLREAVEIFGECGGYASQSQHGETMFPGRGPFYCGMSRVVVMQQFDIALFGPTSTSKCVEVATRFGGDDGIVIQLNNNGENDNIWLKSFSCAWLSCHSAEEEWLFCGGKYKIKIENITIMSNHQTFGKFFDALFYFDCMVSGSRMDFGGFNIQSVQDKG
eukprot:1089089_1